ncbi:MAG: DEAD/DEAH box helicase family protein [Rikenellaceae bacterium]
MNSTAKNIKQRLSMREPLCDALDVVAQVADKIKFRKPPVNPTLLSKEEQEALTSEQKAEMSSELKSFLSDELSAVKELFPYCKDFERDFPSLAFSIATGIGKTRLMGACIAYLYLKKGIKNFFVLAPNLTLYEKLVNDFTPNTPKYVFNGIAEFVHCEPKIINASNYDDGIDFSHQNAIRINIFNISKFNSDSKSSKRGTPKMRRLSEYLGSSYFNHLASLDDLVILMDEAHRYHADASKKAINELRPVLGLEMTATPTDEKGKAFKNIIFEYNLAQALTDGKYVKIPTVAKRKNFQKSNLSDSELDALKIDDAINLHEQTKTHLELYALNNNKPIVKPFILVVCKNIQHAKETFDLIENENMFDGKYRGKVLQIDSSTKKDEEIDKLFLSLENYDNQIEIVIHVNMLKEGWDVTNLYTIVPLRAADAPILVEQSIGRGLRLPYGGRRTGDKNVDKLTVIAHENFEAVIAKAEDPNSVLSKFSFIELDDADFKSEPGRVVTAQTVIDFQEKEAIASAKTEIERKNAQTTSDARRAVWKVIPQMNIAVKNKEELSKPQNRETIRRLAILEIKKSAMDNSPIFAAEETAKQCEELDEVLDMVLENFIDNVIPIPRMTVMNEVYIAEFKWFDLNTSLGFDLPSLNTEIIRISIGAGEKEYEVIQIKTGRKFASPKDEIVSALIDFDEVDYDDNTELLYHLTQQALAAIASNLEYKDDLAKVVTDFKLGIARNIYEQMMNHFTITSQGYQKPNVLPYVGMVEQNLREVDGYGYTDFRDVIPAGMVRKFIYTGFMKSYYTQYKFDSKTEQDFAIALETDPTVLHWLRPAATQFNIYWSNGARKYEPDFVVETSDCIYLLETKAAKDITTEEVIAKKIAAEEYCKHATEYTTANGGKPWKYRVISHLSVDRTHSLEYILSNK